MKLSIKYMVSLLYQMIVKSQLQKRGFSTLLEPGEVEVNVDVSAQNSKSIVPIRPRADVTRTVLLKYVAKWCQRQFLSFHNTASESLIKLDFSRVPFTKIEQA